MSNQASSNGGIGFFGLLTILFIGLKLGGVIAWSWFWVLSPVLLPIVVILVMMFIALTLKIVGVIK